MEALHGQLLAGEPLEHPPPGRLGCDRVLVEGELPAGMLERQRRVVGHVLDQEEPLASRGDEIRRVADRVTGRPDRGHPGRHLLVPGMGADTVGEWLEDAAVVREQVLHPAGGRARSLVVVHPEAPLVRGHGDRGTRKGRVAVLRQEAVHVVAVEVRDDHRVDVGWPDADCGEVPQQEPCRRAGLGRRAGAHSRVDEDGLAGRPDHGRVEGRVAVAVGEAVGGVGALHLLEGCVEHEPLGHGGGALAVGDHDDLDLADPVGVSGRGHAPAPTSRCSHSATRGAAVARPCRRL